MEAALRERLIVNEEEDEKHGVGSGERDPRDHVDRLRHADRVRRFFFANLDETWLRHSAVVGGVSAGTRACTRCARHKVSSSC